MSFKKLTFSMVFIISLGLIAVNHAAIGKSESGQNYKKPSQQKHKEYKLSYPSIPEYSPLNNAINNLTTGDVNSFKQNLIKTFGQISIQLPLILTNETGVPEQVYNDISNIEYNMTKLGTDATVQDMIDSEKSAIDSIVSAIRSIESTLPLRMPGFTERLTDIDQLSKRMNTNNYRQQSQVIFRKISRTMQDLSYFKFRNKN